MASGSPDRTAHDPRGLAVEGAGNVSDELDREYRTLQRRAHIGKAHWAIVAGSLLLTLSAWQLSKQFVHDRAEARFAREHDRVTGLVAERLLRYEDALRAGTAMFQTNAQRVSHEEWQRFVATLDIVERYPGAGALSVVFAVPHIEQEGFVARQREWWPEFRIHPAFDAPLHLPVTFVAPLLPNASAVGLDLMYETERRRTILGARDSGQVRISAPLSLSLGNTKKSGFLFLIPMYTGEPQSVVERRAAFEGLISMPFVVNELMQGALSHELRQVSVRIRDAGTTIHDEFSPDVPSHDSDPVLADSSTMLLHGRRWTFDVQSDLSFRAQAGLGTPRLVLISGLIMDAALLLVFSLMSRANRRALAFAGRSAAELRDNMATLRRSNRELESFAHVVSHDLKTPLRGIGDLVEYLEEDLQPALSAGNLPDEIALNLTRLDTQRQRMTALIDGILGYSALGREQIAVEPMDTAKMLTGLVNDFGLRPEQFSILGPQPVFDSQPVRFQQVMHNLIGNAIKHHHDLDHLHIVLEITPRSGGWSFALSDNGPGIDARYHDSVFEVFKKLRSKDEVEGSGVGLSIVQRSVQIVGGTVTLTSTPGRGSCFTIFWPEASAGASAGKPLEGTVAAGTGAAVNDAQTLPRAA